MAAQLKIRDLELVVALHEEGTFTQAARRLSITEPAFSKRLQLVEREVKARLFERGHDGATATDSGRMFVAHAAESIHSFQRAVHEAQEAKHGERHKLYIGVSAYLSTCLIEILQSIELPLHRDLSIEIATGRSSELLIDLQQRKIDLALVTSPTQTPTITTHRISTDPFMIFFRKNHPLANKTSVTLADIAAYPWLFFKRSVHASLYDLILRRMEEVNLQPRILHQLTQVNQVDAVLKDDQTIAWLNAAATEHVANRGFVHIPLIDDHIRMETHVVTLANNNSLLVSEFVRKFVKRTEEYMPAKQLILPIGQLRGTGR